MPVENDAAMAPDNAAVERHTPATILPGGLDRWIHDAIRIQRPAVIAHIKAVRRIKPEASPAQVIKFLEANYLAAVTAASAGVGATAAVPGVGTAVAVGLSVADLVLFFELSALHALSVAEIHGLAVEDPERARLLVLGLTMGDDGQDRVKNLVMGAVTGGGAKVSPRDVVGDVTKAGAAVGSGAWGDLVAVALPEGQLNPIAKQLLATGAAKLGARAGSGTFAKVLPFGVGAVVGGVASFFFGRSVVTASRAAFSAPPTTWPAALELADSDGDGIPDLPRPVTAMRAAAASAKDFTEEAWSKVAGGVVSAASVFRSIDLDGDGIPDEARALSAVKGVGRAATGVTGGAAAIVHRLKPRRPRTAEGDAGDPALEADADDAPTPGGTITPEQTEGPDDAVDRRGRDGAERQ